HRGRQGAPIRPPGRPRWPSGAVDTRPRGRMGEVTSGRAALGSWGPLGGLIGWTLRVLPGADPTALASAIRPGDACVATSRDDLASNRPSRIRSARVVVTR